MPHVHAADGTSIHYDNFGRTDGEPLVMIMGLAVDRWGWVRQRVSLGRRFRCIAIDNRGSGLSDKPAGRYDLVTMVDDVCAVLDAEGIESAHVMGYSLGGVISQGMGVLRPDRVRSLVLASTACRVQAWRHDLMSEWVELLETGGVSAFARENLRWIAAARYVRWVAPIAPLFAPLMVRAPKQGVAGQIAVITDIDEAMTDQLGEITVPTLIVVGSQDILTPVADSEEIKHRIPHATLKVISGAAHGLVVTRASAFNRAVSDFHTEVLATS